LNEGNASFFQKKYYPTLLENFIGIEEFENQKKFQSKKKWRVEIIFGKPGGLELTCTE
jgi:hypothetical protein